MLYVAKMNVGFTYYIRDKTDKSLVYYGSSQLPTLEDRMKYHVYGFKSWKNKNNTCKYYHSFKVLEKDNYEYDIIEIVYFDDIYDLHQHERLLIEGQICVNKNVPNRTMAEYYQKNKEKRLKESKQYYQDNKEKQLKYGKEYRKKNTEKIKSSRSKKFDCPCGGKYTHKHKSRHLKTAKHQKWLCKSIA